MASLIRSRGAQYPLVAEFVFNYTDQMAPVSIGGVAQPYPIDPKAAQYDFGSGTGATSAYGAPGVSGVAQTNIYEIMSLPSKAQVIGGDLHVETAYAGAATATLSVGDATTANLYASAVDLKTAARTALTLPLESVSADAYAGKDVRMTLTLGAGAATAGRVRVRVMYTVDGRTNEVQST